MSIDRRKREDRYTPIGVVDKGRKDAIEARKELFDQLNRFITEHNGFVISIPGADSVTFEVLEGSPLPWMLIEKGWVVVAADPPTGERIISGSITEKFVRRADGELEPLTPESTRPVAEVRHHAGIVQTLRYRFEL